MEIWNSIKGYKGSYEVSNEGRVRSLDRIADSGKGGKIKLIGKIKNLRLRKDGYLTCKLCKNGKNKSHLVHHLVALSFLDPVPYGVKMFTEHRNKIRDDNRVENLKIKTSKNNKRKYRAPDSSKYVGVSWSESNKKWRAQISFKGKLNTLGYFDTELEASETYKSDKNKNKKIL